VQQHIHIWRQLKTAATVAVDDDDVIAECDLMEKINAPVQTLSGGQMRKLQLAISFVGGSKVCCIDEASSGLVILRSIHTLDHILTKYRTLSRDATSGTLFRRVIHAEQF